MEKISGGDAPEVSPRDTLGKCNADLWHLCLLYSQCDTTEGNKMNHWLDMKMDNMSIAKVNPTF